MSSVDRRPSNLSTVSVKAKKSLPSESSAYKFGSKIGSGSFSCSTLWLASNNAEENDDSLYVMKKLEVDKLTAKELKIIQHEIQVSSHLNHLSILPFYASFVVENGFLWTLLPLYNFGSCRDVISSEFHHGLPVLLVSMVLRSVVLALEYLHKMGYVHRGVNASHILLSSDNKVSLSGLRHCLALPLDQTMMHDYPDDTVQLLPWVAPEVLQQNLTGYNDRCDIYSLGITAVELVTGNIPFCKLRPTEILLQKIRGVVPQLPDKATIEELHCDLSTSNSSLDGLEQTNDMMFSPQITNAPSKRIRNLQQFVDVCLQADFNLRPSASQLRQCSYMKNVKRKVKDKDCPAIKDLLAPLNPILDCIQENLEDPNAMELVEKVPNVYIAEDPGWVF